MEIHWKLEKKMEQYWEQNYGIVVGCNKVIKLGWDVGEVQGTKLGDADVL